MKKFILSLLTIAACSTVQAADVSQQQAMAKAKAFVSQLSGGRRAAADIQLRTAETGIRQLHTFNLEGGGYVIVSASDRTRDVLGYAPQGALDGHMPPAMMELLKSYAQQITEAEQGDGDAADNQEQEYLLKNEIAPLIKQHWGQGGEPGKPYNNLTPMVKDGDKEIHGLTGCVATAMAMLMKYNEWPKGATPVLPATKQIPELPSITFNWAAMTDEYNEKSTKEACDAVATLMQYCGSACQMDYFGTASSSDSYKMSLGLVRFFGYNSDSIEVTRRPLVTEWEWQMMIYNELEKKRPVVCGGDGHEFIIDGYKLGDYFHINWGWDGGRDGFFQLSVGAHYPKKSIRHFPYEIVTGVVPTKTPYSYDETLTTAGFKLTMDTPSQMQRSGDTDFPVVKIDMVLHNLSRQSKDNTYDIGLGLYDKDKKLVKAVEAAKGKTVKYDKYLENIQGAITFGQGLADGHYELYPVSRVQGVEKWEQNEDVNSNYIDVNISGNQLTMISHPRPFRLQVNSITYSGVLQEGCEVTATANITNKSDFDYDAILILSESGDGTMISAEPLKEVRACLPARKTVDVEFKFSAGEAKTYKTYILIETTLLGNPVDLVIKPYEGTEYYNDILLEKTMTLKNVKEEKPYSDRSKQYVIMGRELDMTVTMKNPSSDKNYRGLVSVIIYKGKENPDQTIEYEPIDVWGPKEVIIEPGKSVETKFYTDKFELFGKYALWVQTTYNNDENNDKTDIYSPIEMAAGINVYKKDRSLQSFPAKEDFTVPDDALAVELNAVGVKTLTPNSNPNCLYFLDDTDPKPAALQGRNVVVFANNAQTAENITLTDGYDFMTPYWFTAKKITYKRTFADDEYNTFTTLMLPFTAQKCEAGGEAFTLDKMLLYADLPGKVYLTNTDEMPVIGSPMFLRLKADKKLTNPVTFSATNVEVCDSVYAMTAGRYHLVGSFVKAAYPDVETFSFADGKGGSIIPKTTTCSPFRASFQPIGMPTNFENLIIDATTYGPTSIDVRRTDADATAQPYYNLSGQRVLHPRRGLYIQGGRKIVK